MNALVAELQQGIRLRDSVNAALMLEIERLKKEQKTALRRASRLGERAGVSSGQVVDFPTRSE
jgi:hypothetical protein